MVALKNYHTKNLLSSITAEAGLKRRRPEYAIQLPEDKVTLLGSRHVPYGPEVDSHLIAHFNPSSFNELVDIIYDVLCQVELARFPKGFAMGQEGSDGETDWQISRERVYVFSHSSNF